jgi:diguanylate cyclase
LGQKTLIAPLYCVDGSEVERSALADRLASVPDLQRTDPLEKADIHFRRRPTRLVGIAVVFFCLYLVWQITRLGTGHTALIGNLFLVAGDLLAIYSAATAMRRCRADHRRYWSWGFVALAMIGYLVGNLLQGYHEVVGHLPDTPDWADAVFYACFFVGLLGFAKSRQSTVRRWQFTLDTVTITLGGGAVLWYFVAGPLATTAEGHPVHQVVYAIIFPLGDLILLVAAVRTLQRGVQPSSARAVATLAAGIVVYVVADTVLAYLEVHGSHGQGDRIDIVTVAATMLFVVAGALQPEVQLPEPNSRPSRLSFSWITYVAALAAFALVFVVQRHDPFFPDLSIAAVAVAVAVLIAASQILGNRALVSEQEKNKDLVVELRHQAFHDGLTGLANRALFNERLEHALARRRSLAAIHAILMIDLNDFKSVNDSLGHDAGDELLSIVAERLGNGVRRGDTVARVGGDEFALLLEDVTSEQDAVELVRHLLEVLRKPVTIGGSTLVPEASVGIALTQEEPRTADELLRFADAAMYLAKRERTAHYRVFETEMQSAMEERVELEAELRGAVGRGELRVFYQPILDLTSQRLIGFEALVRWQHPTRGLLAPAAFVPLAEKCGLVHEMDTWVLNQATLEAGGWLRGRSGLGRLCVHVNLSPLRLYEADLVDSVGNALSAARLPAELLTLELLESSVVADLDVALARLTELKALGVRIAVDDFGTGYSSMNHLRTLPIDELKIDRSFIAAMENSAQASTLVRSLIQLGAALGIGTVAEGIEDAEQLVRLQEEECPQGQGYLFAKPLGGDDLKAYLDEYQFSEMPGYTRR